MIEDPNFSLTLDAGWLETPGSDADHYAFHDPARGVAATLSALALDADPDALANFAEVFAEMRMQAEADAARALGHLATIYEPIVAPQSWGQAIAWYGHDDSGRQFSFSGIVTPSRVISLYMSSSRLSEAQLAVAMDEVLTRIEFDRTPLAELWTFH